MVYYFSAKYFPAHKKQAALREIYNFVQIEEDSLPQAWGRLLQLLNALPDHPLKKSEILDIFYNRLTVLKLKMLTIYPLLKKYMVLIYCLLNKYMVLITRHR